MRSFARTRLAALVSASMIASCRHPTRGRTRPAGDASVAARPVTRHLERAVPSPCRPWSPPNIVESEARSQLAASRFVIRGRVLDHQTLRVEENGVAAIFEWSTFAALEYLRGRPSEVLPALRATFPVVVRRPIVDSHAEARAEPVTSRCGVPNERGTEAILGVSLPTDGSSSREEGPWPRTLLAAYGPMTAQLQIAVASGGRY